MKKRNQLLESFIDGLWQYAQFALLIACIILPSVLKFSENKLERLIDINQKAGLNLTEIMFLIIIKKGDIIIGIALALVLFGIFVKNNSEKVLNSGNHYHVHTSFYYWMCSHILGYKECSLILVPIYMQIKLVINGIFKNYYYGDDNSYSEEDNEEICITKENCNSISPLINIIVSDTYPVSIEKIPNIYRMNSTFIIRRKENDKNKNRIYSKSLIETITNVIQDLPETHDINLYATTNPKNTYYITNTVFRTAERGKIKHLKVFTQSKGSENDWMFDEKGIKIY